jgi:acetolactate synthase-1/2/3 large subunit
MRGWTGKVGVCIATSGPGATNLVTGLANAQLDSVPVVAITGQVPQPMIGRDAFQETDITGITLPITKHNYLVQRVEDIAPTIREAFHLARSGRPGPVLVDIPKNLFIESGKFKVGGPIERRGYQPSLVPNMRQVRLAADLITGRGSRSSWPATGSCWRRRRSCSRSWSTGPAYRSSSPCSARAASPSRTRSRSG